MRSASDAGSESAGFVRKLEEPRIEIIGLAAGDPGSELGRFLGWQVSGQFRQQQIYLEAGGLLFVRARYNDDEFAFRHDLAFVQLAQQIAKRCLYALLMQLG